MMPLGSERRVMEMDELSVRLGRLAHAPMVRVLTAMGQVPTPEEAHTQAVEVGKQIAIGWLLFLKHFVLKSEGDVELGATLLPQCTPSNSTGLWDGLRRGIMSLPLSYDEVNDVRRGLAQWMIAEGGSFLLPHGLTLDPQPGGQQVFVLRKRA